MRIPAEEGGLSEGRRASLFPLRFTPKTKTLRVFTFVIQLRWKETGQCSDFNFAYSIFLACHYRKKLKASFLVRAAENLAKRKLKSCTAKAENKGIENLIQN